MVRFVAPSIERVDRPGGGFILRSRVDPPPHARCLGDTLIEWATRAPNRTLYAERDAGGAWRHVSYREALEATRALGQALLDLGLGANRPLMVLSGNSIDHALLALGAMHVGVPIVPLSPAYSLMSTDHAKLRALAAIVRPGALYVADRDAFAKALAAFALDVPVLDPERVAELCRTPVTPAVDAAFASVSGETIAKLLFTSGSTGTPKAVINTQRMMCANQAALAAGWAFLADRPPVIVDWLPWSHTFGGNHNANLVLTHGGTLYIDGGKPAPDAFDETLRNLREIPSTIYFNVPRGLDLLVGHLETDATLREMFFRELEVVFYAAAALSSATWQRLEATAAIARRPIAMTSAWGSTETAPLVTQVSYAIDRAGVIGAPIPGVELALVPTGDKLEMRVKGPSIAPGYLRADHTVDRTALPFGSATGRGQAPTVDRTALPFGSAAGRGHAPTVDRTALPFGSAAGRGQAPTVDRTALPFGSATGRGQAPTVDRTALPFGSADGRGHAPTVDRTALPFGSAAGRGQAPTVEPLPLDELGFYPMGDAGRLADPSDPAAGVVFEGRTSENFKLASGTWVHVGEVRIALIAACSPLVADAVICGHDRAELGALIFLAPGRAATPELRAGLRTSLAKHAATCTSSSTRITCVVILDEPADIDAGEITDKGYLNQRAILDRRATDVARLFSDAADIVRSSD